MNNKTIRYTFLMIFKCYFVWLHSMQKPFNFKLLVPPRAHLNQVYAVKPQETGLFEENGGFPSKMVLPTKASRPGNIYKI